MACLTGCSGSSNAGGDRPAPPPIAREKIEIALDAADAQRRGGHFERAEAILRELIERLPDEFDAIEMLGQVLLQRGAISQQEGRAADAKKWFEQAWRQYERAIELRPEEAGLRQSAGEVASIAGHTEEALAQFRRASALDSSNVKHPLYAAQMLLSLKRIDEADREIQRAVRIDPREPYVLATLATIQFERGELATAIETIREARSFAAAEQSLPLRVMEARFCRLSGNPQRAIQLLLPLEAHLRIDAGVTSELAAAFDATGDVDRAIETWSDRFMATGDGHAAAEAGLRCATLGRSVDVDLWLQRAQINGASEADVARLIEAVEGMAQDG